MAGSKVGSAWYDLRADEKGLQGDLKRATGTITKSGSTAGTGFSSGFGKGLAGIKSSIGSIIPMVGALSAAFAVTKIVSFFGDAIAAAREEEASIATLTQSIKTNDQAWDGNIAAIEKVIEERQALGFADDEQRDSLRSLVAVTGDSSKALEVQRTAMDLARLRGMSLSDATLVLGKVYGGNIGILSRYGIQIDKGATSTEALAKIQEMAAGQAEAFGQTAEGAALAAGIAFDNMTEDIGKLLLPAVRDLSLFVVNTAIPAIRGFVDSFSDPDSVMGNIVQGIGMVVDAVTETIDIFTDWNTNVDISMGALGKTIEDRANEIGVDVVTMKNLVRTNMTDLGMDITKAMATAEREMAGLPPVMSDAVNATVAAWKERDLSGSIAADVIAGAPVIDAGVEAGITDPAAAELEATRLAAENAARAMTADYASTIASGADNVTQAWDALLKGAETEMSETARIAEIEAMLAAPALTNALHSEDPYLRAQAVSTKQTLLDELELLKTGAIDRAVATGEALPDALAAQKEKARIAAYQTRLATTREFDLGALPASTAGTRMGVNFGVGIGGQASNVGVKARGVVSGAVYEFGRGNASAGGASLVNSWIGGMRDAYWARGINNVAAIANSAGRILGMSLPTDGPLKGGIASGGQSVIQSWAQGMAQTGSTVQSIAFQIAEIAAGSLISRIESMLNSYSGSIGTGSFGTGLGTGFAMPPVAVMSDAERMRRLQASLAAASHTPRPGMALPAAPGMWSKRQFLTAEIAKLQLKMQAAERIANLAKFQATQTAFVAQASRIPIVQTSASRSAALAAFNASRNSTGPVNTVINVNGYNRDPVELSRTIANTIRLRARAV